jgi:hypothetical protein
MGLGGINNPLDPSVVPANTSGATSGISWPANRGDGTNTNSLAIPEGLRFRLPASLNLTTYNTQHPLTPIAMAIAVAAQKYGFVVDARSGSNGGSIGLNLGDSTPYTVAGLSNPYASGPGVGGVGDQGLFGGLTENNQLMANFPWSYLEALPFNYGEPN